MILNKIKLHNIRSYIDAEVSFGEGTTLLAGDVGSGKSSILLAIDFALFGITPNLPGETLLRNGAKSGHVEMAFNVEGKNITIRRGLARNKSIAQDDCQIKINGNLLRCTPTEIKQHVITLLNYPKELVTKSKNLIYRYTVYTPQEEMKKILQEENEIRVDTLRKVFGIDKYKRIRENADIFSDYLKSCIKNISFAIADLNAKNKDLKEYIENDARLKNELGLMKPRIDKMKKELGIKKSNAANFELKIKEMNMLKNKGDVHSMKLKYLCNDMGGIKKELENVELKLKEHDVKEIIDVEFNNVDELMKKEKAKLDIAEKSYIGISSQINVIRSEMNNANMLVEKINSLNFCPLCKQNVSEMHKHSIKEEENKKTKNFDTRLSSIMIEEKNIIGAVKKLKAQIEQLNEEKQKNEVNKIKLKNLNEFKKRKEELTAKKIMVENNIKETEIIIQDMKNKLALFLDVEEKYEIAKIDYEKYMAVLRDLEIKHGSINTRYIDNKNIISMLEKEVKTKQMQRDKINDMEELRSWLSDSFVELIAVMEKKVMSKIYGDFNSLFKKWFDVIMGEEGIIVDLDDEFNPSIEQNGYDVDYASLSGGEKTAIALAYRLALNQVINNLVTDIRTNNLIILDEPTDGFSDDQVSRIKDVLDELAIKQIIIVSHEQKIEGFVDSIIKVKKEDHVSSVC